ncbi:MAG: hypothetical protein ACXWYP_09990 [Pseudonocardia sp.]
MPDVDAEGRAGGEQVDEVVATQLVGRGPPHVDVGSRSLTADPHDAVGQTVEARVALAEHRERAPPAHRGCGVAGIRAGRPGPGVDRHGSAGEPVQVLGGRGGQPCRRHHRAVRGSEHRCREDRAGRTSPGADHEHGARSVGHLGQSLRVAPGQRAPGQEPQAGTVPPEVEERGEGVGGGCVGDHRDRVPSHAPLPIPGDPVAHAARTSST